MQVPVPLYTPNCKWFKLSHKSNFSLVLIKIYRKKLQMMYFFSLGKTTEGPAGATRGGLGRAAEGPRPSVQVPVLEPGRVRSPAGSRTNRATLVNIIFLLDGR
jgi:hypothetical protein